MLAGVLSLSVKLTPVTSQMPLSPDAAAFDTCSRCHGRHLRPTSTGTVAVAVASSLRSSRLERVEKLRHSCEPTTSGHVGRPGPPLRAHQPVPT